MSQNCEEIDFEEVEGWRRPAPIARRAAMGLYAWQEPGWTFLAAMLAALPFVAAAYFAPALLSLAPTLDMIAPIAEARAIVAGEASLMDASAPAYAMLLIAADIVAETPGRIHLVAKALCALLVAYPLAYFASSRFPIIQAVVLTAGFAAFVASPFSGAAEFGLALLLAAALCFISASADSGPGRARFEGVLAGGVLFMLWMLNPVFALAGFAALSACPFLSGARGLDRYVFAIGAFLMIALLAEYFAPGVNLVRASAASAIFDGTSTVGGRVSSLGLSGIAVSAVVVMVSAGIFGGREHIRSWAPAAILILAALGVARLTGANPIPVFVLAAGLASFSIASPFYDGLFRDHDRASVSVALTAGALTLFWAIAMPVHATGQFALQYHSVKNASDDIRFEFGLVQPGGPTIARWVEEGRFSTPEARELFALAPIDQSALLLEAASRVRQLSGGGMDVAILTGADTACVIANFRKCQADGPAAARASNIVLVPRLDLDKATAEAKGRSEVLLYTEFKLVEQTALWEVWVRRGIATPMQGGPAIRQ